MMKKIIYLLIFSFSQLMAGNGGSAGKGGGAGPGGEAGQDGQIINLTIF